jgi:hypothetical protein
MSRAEVEKRKAPSKAAIDYMLRNYGFCALCKGELNGYYEADHKIPLWRGKENGGTNEPENFRPLCRSCHKDETSKGSEDRSEVRALSGETGQRARRSKKGGSIVSNGSFPSRLDNKIQQRSSFPKSRGFQNSKGFNKWK